MLFSYFLFLLLLFMRLLKLNSHKMLVLIFPCETLVFSNDRCYLAFVIQSFWYTKILFAYHFDIITIFVTIGLYMVGDLFQFYKCVLLEFCL